MQSIFSTLKIRASEKKKSANCVKNPKMLPYLEDFNELIVSRKTAKIFIVSSKLTDKRELANFCIIYPASE